jgi:Fatty acid/phospholipid biosynthesis enzyme
MSRRRIRIGVDLMGGDSAPVNELLAVADAERQLPEEVELVLIGHAERVKEAVQRLKIRLPRYPFVHAEEVITMQMIQPLRCGANLHPRWCWGCNCSARASSMPL